MKSQQAFDVEKYMAEEQTKSFRTRVWALIKYWVNSLGNEVTEAQLAEMVDWDACDRLDTLINRDLPNSVSMREIAYNGLICSFSDMCQCISDSKYGE